jgi:threonine synthase
LFRAPGMDSVCRRAESGRKKDRILRYISTRGGAPELDFEGALLAGLARDGGLYVPADWPALDDAALRGFRGKPYAEVAVSVMRPFIGGCVPDADFDAIVAESYAGFDHAAVAPMSQLGPNEWLLELFHGPTLAFKDFALQLLGRLFDHVLAKRGERVTIVGATSGDTGSAAIEACRDRDAVDIFILHPKGRVSEVQRRQMTTVQAANVHNIAIDGTFDDCQNLVKAMFNDAAFRDAMNLSAVNSINWARIMAQTVYYVTAAVSLGAPDRKVAFSVPTGNFGDVFAGYVATRMGLPVERLVIATNANDILDRFFRTGEMTKGAVTATLSPAMDIQVSSNFERLLFDMHGRDGRKVAQAMAAFDQSGTMSVPAEVLDDARGLFASARLDDDGIRAEIAAAQKATGLTVDPHTATGLAAGRACRGDAAVPLVCLSTAHPAKFPDAVDQATGGRPELPERLAALMTLPERMIGLPNDLAAVQAHVRGHSRASE